MIQGILFVPLLALCLTAVGFYLYSIWAASDLFSGAGRAGPDFTPPVSILKPLCGLEEDTYQSLASFCGQDVPQVQIIFGVASQKDPVAEVVRQIIRDFPDQDIQLVICPHRFGTNPKVNSLIQMESRARHPFLLLSDSDIRVGPDYLKRVMQPLGDPAVGAVTCMGRSRTSSFPSVLEALRISTEFCPGVLVARKLEGIKFGLGSTIAMRRQALEAVGGFGAISDFLADDFQMGALIAKAGWKVLLADYVVEHHFGQVTLAQVIRRQIRWARGIRASRPFSYAGLLLTQGTPMSILFPVLTAGSAIGWGLFGFTWAARLLAAYLVGARFLNDRAAQRFFWLVPLQDLISFSVWCAGFFGEAIDWRGERFRLTRSGKLVPCSGCPPVTQPQGSADLQEQRVGVG